jgi:hypothetical protein
MPAPFALGGPVVAIESSESRIVHQTSHAVAFQRPAYLLPWAQAPPSIPA